MKILLLGTGYHTNLLTNVAKLVQAQILQYNLLSLQDILALGVPYEIPIIYLLYNHGLTGSDLYELNMTGYTLVFLQEDPSGLNSLLPSNPFATNSYNWSINGLSAVQNSYFEYINESVAYPIKMGFSSYHLTAHPNCSPIIIVDASRIAIGVITQLPTSFGICKTPLIYASILNKANIDENSLLIFQDILTFGIKNSVLPYTISGSVYNKVGEPLIRKVAVYEEETGQLLKIQLSLSDGSYKIDLYDNSPKYVVALPQGDGNALIKYGIIPKENV